jgi:dipeptidyl aminopeptidase/acylaminoacyl peptidase
MNFADLQALKRISDPQISVAERWVLFTVTDVSLEKNSKVSHVWSTPMSGNKSPQQLTFGSGESNARFSPNGKSVMYVSSETGTTQLWIATWNGGTGTMSAGHQVTSLETEADSPVWAADSTHFLFVSDVYPECESKAPMGTQRNEEEANCNAAKDTLAAKNPVKALVFTKLLYRHWDHYMGDKRSHIFYGSIEPGAGAPTDLTPASVIGDHVAPTFSLGGPIGYAISPDGKEVAYEVNLDKVPAESTNNDIFTLQVGAEPNTAKKVSTSEGSDDAPSYSPDGKWLAWRTQARNGYESDETDLLVMDRATGKQRNLTADFDGGIDEFTWGAYSHVILFTGEKRGESPLFAIAVTENAGHFNPLRERKETGQYGDLHLLKSYTVVAMRMTVDHPAQVVAIASPPPDKNGVFPAAEEPRELTNLNDALLSQLSLAPLEPFNFAGANGTQVEGFIVKPPNFDATKKYPVKFLIHGGPQGAWGDSWSYRWNPELFAADGYVVVMVNPRGSTGYGQKFEEQVSGDWGGRPYVDLMKGLDYAEQHFSYIDKTRECALGASYGGYMANWVLTHTDRFQCIVTHDGMYNPQSAFGTTEELWFNEWEFRPLASKKADAVVEQHAPAHPWDFYDKPANEDPFRKWSPMMFINNAKTPTLVIHGQDDYRLDVSEGLQLFDSLQMLGVPSKMIYFENEGHWVLKPRDSEFWYSQVNDWCDQWTHTNKYAAK